MSREDEVPRPAPGEELNLGPQTAPRPAATVILLRGGGALEVLLVQRNQKARFMAGVWVFPGGAVEQEELAQPKSHALAARRELREEAGIELPAQAELIELSRWITPAIVKVRFDTVFFLAQLPEGQQAKVDGNECIAHRWCSPSKALQAYAAGEMPLVFPTIKHLEAIAPFASATELMQSSRGRHVEAVQPKVIMDSTGSPRVVLPGEPDY
jgi:8-oxo-dGTP pyrophosphatase MutT (NUDIX family)